MVNIFKKKNKTQEPAPNAPKIPLTKGAKVARVAKIVVPCLLVLAIIVLLLVIVFGESKSIQFSQDGIVATDPQAIIKSKGISGKELNDSGLKLFAENDYLKLSYSPKDDLFVVEDKNTGRQFRSYPAPVYEDKTDSDSALYDMTKESGQIITSPIFVGYTKSGMEGGFVKGINQMKNIVKTVYYIDNGVALQYEIPELQLSLIVEVTLDGSSVKYKVPRNGIVERDTLPDEEEDRRPLLTSLSILPYFDAHRTGDNGYFVTPDGSGALTYFDVSRVNNYNEYSKKIYGYDYTIDSLDSPDYAGQPITMGVYGVVDQNYMLTSFIDSGETNAKLVMGNPGVKDLDFYNIYFQYNYRYFYSLKISKSGTSYSMVVKDMQIGDVEQHIYITTTTEEVPDDGEFYDYCDVALMTRDLILGKWGKQWGVTKENLTESTSALGLKFFMGAQTSSGVLLNQLKTVTTFEDVENICDELAEDGVTDLRLTLLGWTKGGYYWDATTKNKVDSAFGGAKGLKALNEWASEKGYDVSLDNNLLIIYGDAPTGVGASLRNSVIKQPNTFYLEYEGDTTYGRLKSDGYYMSPSYFEDSILTSSIKRLKSYDTMSVTLQQVGNIANTDYNEQNALLRLQVIRAYVSWIGEYKDNFDTVAVYTGNDYAVAFADIVENISMEKSSHILLDESVPFVQMVYHGLVNYYSAPLNNQDSVSYELLKAIEYGSNVTFEVTKNSSNELKYTDYIFLFKAEFDLLKDEIEDAYKAVNEAVKPFATQQIVQHTKIDVAGNVFETEYSGGAKVYVNYSNKDYALDESNVVKAMSYLVVNE